MRKALLIATGTYADPAFGDLRAPRHDADELERVLADPSIGAFTTERLDDEPSGVVRGRLERLFTTAAHDDFLLVHLSGHGVKDRLGRLFFPTTDTAADLLAATAVDARFLRELIDVSPAREVALWLDCCYGGAFPSGMLPRSPGAVDVDQVHGGSGCLVMTAATHIQYAFEPGVPAGAAPAPSVFTRTVVAGLRTGAADLDGDGEITAAELYSYVHDRVQAENPHQTPTLSGTVRGDLVIATAAGAVPLDLPEALRGLLRSSDPELRREGERILAARAVRETPGAPPLPADPTPPAPAPVAGRTTVEPPRTPPVRRSAPAIDLPRPHPGTARGFTTGGVVGPGHIKTVFSGDSELVASGRHVWRTTNWRTAHEFPEGAVCALAGDLVLVSRQRGWAVHSTATWEETGPVAYGGGLDHACFSHDGTLLVIAVHGAATVLARDDEGWHPLDQPRLRDVRAARFSTGSPYLAIVTTGGRVELWDTTTWTTTTSTALHHAESVGVSADGTLVAASSRNSARVWRADTGEVVHQVRWPEFRVPVALSSGLDVLVASTRDGVELWSVAEGSRLTTVPSSLVAPALSPDGRFLAGTTTHWSFAGGPDVQVWARDPADTAGLHPLPTPATPARGPHPALAGAVVGVGTAAGTLAIGDWPLAAGAGGVAAVLAGLVVKRVWPS